MAETSLIEWTDATWNIVTGCSVVSPGCTNCYAMRLAGTRLKHHRSREGLTRDTKAGPVWTGAVRFNEEWLLQPLQWKRPRKIFVCAHGDLFHDGVTDEQLDRIFAVMALAPQHVFQVLTKRPERMRAYVSDQAGGGRFVTEEIARILAPLPGGGYDTALAQDREQLRAANARAAGTPWEPRPLPNVWLGVSVEDQQRADERIPILLDTPAAVRWLSMEPLLGPVNIVDAMWAGDGPPEVNLAATLDWIVLGGESGPGARPMHPDWARSVRDQCAAAGVPFHFKQWGNWAPYSAVGGIGWKNRTPQRPSYKGPTLGDVLMPGVGYTDRSFPTRFCEDGQILLQFGKKAAGRLLDGVEHNGVPAHV